MGHWAEFNVGNLIGYSYKYEVPIIMLFIFDKNDLVKRCIFGNKKIKEFKSSHRQCLMYCESQKSAKCNHPFNKRRKCKGENDCQQEWIYITNTGKVKERMNFYGLTLDFCKETYDLLKSSEKECWDIYLEFVEDFRGKEYPQFGYKDEASFSKIKKRFIQAIIIEDQKSLSELGIDAKLHDVDIYVRYLKYLIEHNKLRGLSDHLAWYGKVPHQVWRVADLIPIEEDLDTNYGHIGQVFYLRLLVEATTPDIPVTLNTTDIWLIDPKISIAKMHQDLSEIAINKLKLYNRMFNFLVEKQPEFKNIVQKKLMKLDEDSLLHKVLVPLLNNMGFQEIRIQIHGPGEFGKDIYPFKSLTQLGNAEYYSVQAKSVKIHGNIKKRKGNVSELLLQAQKAFNIRFIDLEDNEEKNIDKLLIVSNKQITSEARREIQEGIRGNRKIIFMDLEKLTNLAIKYGLGSYILFSAD